MENFHSRHRYRRANDRIMALRNSTADYHDLSCYCRVHGQGHIKKAHHCSGIGRHHDQHGFYLSASAVSFPLIMMLSKLDSSGQAVIEVDGKRRMFLSIILD